MLSFAIMRALRILLVLVWTAGVLLGAASAQDGCEHGVQSAAEAMTDMAMTHVGMDHADDAAAHEDHDGRDGCDPGCCDGACACEGVASTAALTPAPVGDAARPAREAASRPTDTRLASASPGTEGPPPRLL